MKKKISNIIISAITGLSLISLFNCSEETSLVGSIDSNEQVSKTRTSSNTVAIRTWDFTASSAAGWSFSNGSHIGGGSSSIYPMQTKGGDFTKSLSSEESASCKRATKLTVLFAQQDDWNDNPISDFCPSKLIVVYNNGVTNEYSIGSGYSSYIDIVPDNKFASYKRYKVTIPISLTNSSGVKTLKLRIPNTAGGRGERLIAIDRVSLETSIDELASKNIPFRLKNRWSKKYMHIENKKGLLEVGDLGHPLWWSAQWYFEKAPDGYYRIRNRWQGGDDYIHVQDRSDYVEVSEMRYSSWWSAQWEINNFEDENYVQFRNRWKKYDVINNESKAPYAQSSNSTHPTGWWSSQWIIEVVE